MIEKRCQYCGRTLKQPPIRYEGFSLSEEHFDGVCIRCSQGDEPSDIAHTKAVRAAWKYRRNMHLYKVLYQHRVKVDKLFKVPEDAIKYLEGKATVGEMGYGGKSKVIHLTLDDRADLTSEDHDAIIYLEERGYKLAEREMTDKELKRCQDFLDKMGCNWRNEVIWLSSGGNSLICNPSFEPKEFQGHCVNNVAEAVAKKMGKKIEWIDEGRY